MEAVLNKLKKSLENGQLLQETVATKILKLRKEKTGTPVSDLLLAIIIAVVIRSGLTRREREPG